MRHGLLVPLVLAAAALCAEGCVTGKVLFVQGDGSTLPAADWPVWMRECDTCDWKYAVTDATGTYTFDPYLGTIVGGVEVPELYNVPSGEAFHIVTFTNAGLLNMFHRPEWVEVEAVSGATRSVTFVPDVLVSQVASMDADGDGISDYLEVFAHGTNPTNPDTDADGLADSTEIYGLLGVDYRGLGADPLHKDIFYEVDYDEPDSTRPFLPDFILASTAALLAGLDIPNPDGTLGANLWLLPDRNEPREAGLTCRNEAFMSQKFTDRRRFGFRYMRLCRSGGDGGVAQFPHTPKYGEDVCDTPCSHSACLEGCLFGVYRPCAGDCAVTFLLEGNVPGYVSCLQSQCDPVFGVCADACRNETCYAECDPSRLGRNQGTRMVAWGNFNDDPASDEDNYENTRLHTILLHEMGHNLFLSHGGGTQDENYKPNYPSVMNYAYRRTFNAALGPLSTTQVQFSDGHLDEIDEESVFEFLPFPGEGDSIKFLEYYLEARGGEGFDVTANTLVAGDYDVNWDRDPFGVIHPLAPLPNVRVRFGTGADGFRDLRDYNDSDGVEVGIPQSVPFVLPDVHAFLGVPTYTYVRDRGVEFPPDFQNPAFAESGMPVGPGEEACLGGDPEEDVPWTLPDEGFSRGLSTLATALIAKRMRIPVAQAQLLANQLGVEVELLEDLAVAAFSARRQSWLAPDIKAPPIHAEIRKRNRALPNPATIEEIDCDPPSIESLTALVQRVEAGRKRPRRLAEGSLGSESRPFTVAGALGTLDEASSGTLRLCRH